MNNRPQFTVEIYHDVAPYLAGVSEKDFFLDADKLILAWNAATEWTLDTFHGRIPPREPTAAPNSYGHLICLGAPIRYSDSAEPNISPAADSLEDAIRLLEDARGMDFTACPIFRQYVELSARLREVYPSSPAIGGLVAEGPLTSAVLYRGTDFYMDMIDEPERAAYYLELMTDSSLAFRAAVNTFCGRPAVSNACDRFADDLASMVPPSMWDEMVVPFWRRHFAGMTTGAEHPLHCEALVPAHLPYLEKAGVTHYQPSVSPQITLESLRANTALPFDWLLYMYHVTEMTDQQIADWVAEAIPYGPTAIRTQLGAYTIQSGKVDRIQAFLDVADSYR